MILQAGLAFDDQSAYRQEQIPKLFLRIREAGNSHRSSESQGERKGIEKCRRQYHRENERQHYDNGKRYIANHAVLLGGKNRPRYPEAEQTACFVPEPESDGTWASQPNQPGTICLPIECRDESAGKFGIFTAVGKT